MAPSLMSMVWFVVVLALIPLGLLWLKRSPMGRQLAHRQQMAGRVVGQTSLGPQQRLVAVEVGDGPGRRWLLLGVTPQQITHLMTSVDPLQVAPEPVADTSNARTFQDALAAWRSPKA